jgi:hypothetical protein
MTLFPELTDKREAHARGSAGKRSNTGRLAQLVQEFCDVKLPVGETNPKVRHWLESDDQNPEINVVDGIELFGADFIEDETPDANRSWVVLRLDHANKGADLERPLFNSTKKLKKADRDPDGALSTTKPKKQRRSMWNQPP